ncbi:hypothetical protein ACFLYF_00930 [Chloroflexota bacterium]
MLTGGAIAIVGLVLICFIALVVYALIQLVKMFCHGLKGVPYKFDPNETPDNVLEAIEPIDVHTNLKEYRSILARQNKAGA